MKKTALWIIIMLFIVCLIGSACGGETSFDTEQLEAKTTTIVQHLLDGDYEAASSYFAPELTQQLPVESLQAGWEQMVGPSGNYIGQESLSSNIEGNRCTVAALLRFANNGILVSITYDSNCLLYTSRCV